MPTKVRALAWVLPLVALSACGTKPSPNRSLNALDADLAQNSLVNTSDATFAGRSNKDALLPPHQRYSGATPPDSVAPDSANARATASETPKGSSHAAPTPERACPQCKIRGESVTLGALTQHQSDKPRAPCAGTLRYSTAWAQRLPVDLPLYPGARVDEAAGSASGACALRVVSFSTGGSAQAIVDWYYRRLSSAGYAPELKADGHLRVLGGVRRKDGAACVIYVETRSDRRTHVDLVANNGN